MRVSDLDSDRMMIHVRGGKGKKDRYTLLSVELLRLVREYYRAYRPTEYLFPGAEGRGHISERAVESIFDRALAAASIQALLGHSSSKTTEIYTQNK